MTQTVKATTHLPVPPGTAWQQFGQFGGIADWHPWLDSARVENDGAQGSEDAPLRHVRGHDGSRLTERLAARDPDRHCYAYRLVEGDLPVEDYHAELRFDPAADGGCNVIWQARFTPSRGDERAEGRDHGRETIRAFLVEGTAAMERQLS